MAACVQNVSSVVQQTHKAPCHAHCACTPEKPTDTAGICLPTLGPKRPPSKSWRLTLLCGTRVPKTATHNLRSQCPLNPHARQHFIPKNNHTHVHVLTAASHAYPTCVNTPNTPRTVRAHQPLNRMRSSSSSSRKKALYKQQTRGILVTQPSPWHNLSWWAGTPQSTWCQPLCPDKTVSAQHQPPSNKTPSGLPRAPP